MTTRRNKSLSNVLAVLLVSTATIALLSPANAMSMGGFGHGMGGFGHGMGGFGHSTGGFNSMHMGGMHANSLHSATHLTHSSISKSPIKSTKATAKGGDRDVGGGMKERAGTGTTADRPVGGGMYEKAGTGTTGDRDVGGGMKERAGTGTDPDRDVGGGMKERAGTGTINNGDGPPPPPPPVVNVGISVDDGAGGWVPYTPKPKAPPPPPKKKDPSFISLYDPDTNKTTTRVFNDDGTHTDTVNDGNTLK